ncbi:hypothetical protein GNI_170770 [Gregarina niphandrodes]|uniref:Transmembrane protein n=1 Tax=Gregarina niphandrodes TaxID=110365 RepID=A0A023AYG2_GRENI|nr:hypothetical protein GNI_170770 [Gregarina niphandrodes]EZG43468.1 hypothetical protein GNI_170770 [Gregarina niphandrodes]|eukprot:XP_011133295.1 hypothetical protein GNI_170770 [Gregarina niphandrodes]
MYMVCVWGSWLLGEGLVGCDIVEGGVNIGSVFYENRLFVLCAGNRVVWRRRARGNAGRRSYDTVHLSLLTLTWQASQQPSTPLIKSPVAGQVTRCWSSHPSLVKSPVVGQVTRRWSKFDFYFPMVRAVRSEENSQQSAEAALAVLCIRAPHTRMTLLVRDDQDLEDFFLAAWSPSVFGVAAAPADELVQPDAILSIGQIAWSKGMKDTVSKVSEAERETARGAAYALYETKHMNIPSTFEVTNGDGKRLCSLGGTFVSDDCFRVELRFSTR